MGRFLEENFGKKSKRPDSPEVLPVPHTEETKEEWRRLKGGKDFLSAEDVDSMQLDDNPNWHELTPDKRLELQEALREALDPKNKNKGVARLLREEAGGARNEANTNIRQRETKQTKGEPFVEKEIELYSKKLLAEKEQEAKAAARKSKSNTPRSYGR